MIQSQIKINTNNICFLVENEFGSLVGQMEVIRCQSKMDLIHSSEKDKYGSLSKQGEWIELDRHDPCHCRQNWMKQNNFFSPGSIQWSKVYKTPFRPAALNRTSLIEYPLCYGEMEGAAWTERATQSAEL
ncbi:hypothetical protein RRG08_019846 [Elysia crispata]|uniref:Uncharacterized protein n=1 Tax=Elysia crispata TaxID=231223 RepID=A0AAE1DN31_9GAST|nr:hypothetical protein RRG08_019846 [Elysia crispata]